MCRSSAITMACASVLNLSIGVGFQARLIPRQFPGASLCHRRKAAALARCSSTPRLACRSCVPLCLSGWGRGTRRHRCNGKLHYNSLMSRDAGEILKEALALPPEARAALADYLWDSLDLEVDADAEEAWRQEITRRIVDLDSGKVVAIPWSE